MTNAVHIHEDDLELYSVGHLEPERVAALESHLSDCQECHERLHQCIGPSIHATAGLIYCQQARDLLDAFSFAIREVITLHEQQFQAVVHGDEDSARLDDLIHMANERKREAKYDYLQHLETHGCSRLVPDDLKPSG